MKKIVIVFLLFAHCAFSQVWLSQLGDMMRSIYDTNNDGIVDVAYTSIVGSSSALYALLAGTASNALYAEMSLSNSNSFYADGASNSVQLDGKFADYYTNLSNMIGSIGTNQVANLAAFISLISGSFNTNDLTNYLLLSGGTMTGNLNANAGLFVSNGFTVENGFGNIILNNVSSGNILMGGANTSQILLQSGGAILGLTSDGNFAFSTTNTTPSMINLGGNLFTNVSRIFPYNNELRLGSYDTSVGGMKIQNGIIYIDSGLQINIGTATFNTNGIVIGTTSSTRVSVGRNPTASNHIANKWYVDQATNSIVSGSTVQYLNYNLSGNIVLGSNQILAHIPFDCTFVSPIGAALFGASIGSNLIIDVELNGSSIVSNGFYIADGLKTNTSPIYVTNANMFDEISIHILQIGTNQASDLDIFIPVLKN